MKFSWITRLRSYPALAIALVTFACLGSARATDVKPDPSALVYKLPAQIPWTGDPKGGQLLCWRIAPDAAAEPGQPDRVRFDPIDKVDFLPRALAGFRSRQAGHNVVRSFSVRAAAGFRSRRHSRQTA